MDSSIENKLNLKLEILPLLISLAIAAPTALMLLVSDHGLLRPLWFIYIVPIYIVDFLFGSLSRLSYTGTILYYILLPVVTFLFYYIVLKGISALVHLAVTKPQAQSQTHIQRKKAYILVAVIVLLSVSYIGIRFLVSRNVVGSYCASEPSTFYYNTKATDYSIARIHCAMTGGYFNGCRWACSDEKQPKLNVAFPTCHVACTY